MLPYALKTKRLLFRRPIRSDLPWFTKYCLCGRTKYVGGPFSEVQAFEKLAAMIGHWELRGFGRFVFLDRATERPLGHFGALQLSVSEPPEITWTIWDQKDEGKGFATEAGVGFKSYAKQQLGLSTLIAHVHCDNSASRGLAERLGGQLDAGAVPPSWMPSSVLYRFQLTA
ncbi:GNAT family N-acetyltransferase [Sulfitobacter sp. S0837]|uniref:GNAT family N-acetyltransferase n=1 Tax=Sulfitobacter maritimus TaxID=2741719 RepID=UPI001582ED4A|nr:GNAT family N-acetyltransferase [Sulfitobacter maritimus]NUH65162.1 GNAT family N-acetyltransferase [Sulfitobacter maritimus]